MCSNSRFHLNLKNDRTSFGLVTVNLNNIDHNCLNGSHRHGSDWIPGVRIQWTSYLRYAKNAVPKFVFLDFLQNIIGKLLLFEKYNRIFKKYQKLSTRECRCNRCIYKKFNLHIHKAIKTFPTDPETRIAYVAYL